MVPMMEDGFHDSTNLLNAPALSKCHGCGLEGLRESDPKPLPPHNGEPDCEECVSRSLRRVERQSMPVDVERRMDSTLIALTIGRRSTDSLTGIDAEASPESPR